MASLKTTMNDLLLRVAAYLGVSADGVTLPTGDDLTLVKDIVARGYRRFLYPVDLSNGREHNWTFLQQYHTVELAADTWKYALPEDFSEILTDPVFGDDELYLPLQKLTAEHILDMRAGWERSYAPAYYAIVSAGGSLETGNVDELWVYPSPDTDYQIRFWYRRDPLKPDSTDDFLVGGVKASEAILENCLAVAEQQEDGRIGIHTQLADTLTQKLIQIDSARQTETTIGNLYSGEVVMMRRRGRGQVDIDNIYPGD